MTPSVPSILRENVWALDPIIFGKLVLMTASIEPVILNSIG